jgi:HEPN domain-containing protein
MGKEEQISYWIESAAEDLLHLKRFIHTLFFFHLVTEKLLKANWVADNFGDVPPYTHNLEQLYSQTSLELSAEDVDVIRSLGMWNLEGRYPDYQNKIHKMANEAYTVSKYEAVKRIRTCLLDRLSGK